VWDGQPARGTGGTAEIVDSNTLRVPYSGTTCLGPVSGEETLRRPTQSAPSPEPEPAPAPAPEPTPAPPAESPFHIGPGPLTMARADGRLGPRISAAKIDCMAARAAPSGSCWPMRRATIAVAPMLKPIASA